MNMKLILLGVVCLLVGLFFMSPAVVMLVDAVYWVYTDHTLSGLEWGGFDNVRVPLAVVCTAVGGPVFITGVGMIDIGRSNT